MEDEAEQLDWGNEDDEQMASELRAYKGVDSRVDAEDAEDAISLGSQEGDGDEYYAYQPRAQQDSSRGLSTPKSASFSQQQVSHQASRELQRENSATSQKQFSHSQGSPQHSPNRSSFSKITHALPPKPVVFNVPFLHPSHPSIIEATAMAGGRSDRDKKTNGSTTAKPISASDTGEPLPADWEVRQPRSGGRGGVYFYNIRTHESTWTRPVNSISLRDKEKGRALPSDSRPLGKLGFDVAASAKASEQSRRPEADLQVSVELTYEDRHYRPGGDSKPKIDLGKRDERPSQVSTYDPNPFSPSASPKPDRTHSPLQYNREPDPVKSFGRQSSPCHSPDGRSVARASTRDNVVSDAERRWGPSREPPPAGNSSHRRATPSHIRQQDRDIDMLLSASAVLEDRNSHNNDAVWSSAPRHRSPLYSREMQPSHALQASQTSVSVLPPVTAPVPRQKSRFDRPANPPQNSSRSHDVYVPVDAFSQRGREHELTFAQIDAENANKRMDVENRDRPVEAISNHRTFQSEPTPASIPERSPSPSPSPPASQTEHSRQPKRFRQPLPPQSTRFRDMFRAKDPAPLVDSSGQAPHGPRDGGMVQRSTIANNNVPSGPRFQPQAVRDASHPDFAHGSRAPPSGPSATTSSRARPRTSAETVFTPNESPPLRDRDIMDVDSLPPSRASLKVNDIPIRAGSGMYADREQASDVLPKAPRAMASKISTGNTHLSTTSPSTSPTTPFSAQRSASAQEYVSDRRERSPPPYLGGNDGWEPSRRLPERHSQSVGGTTRPDPTWRADDVRATPTHQDMDMNPARGDLSNNQNRRLNEFSRQPPPLLKLSGTNIVPIGSRKGVNSQVAMPSPVAANRRGLLSGGNTEPVGDRVGHGTQPKESYERSPQFNFKPLPPAQSYRPTLAESISAGQRRRAHSPQPFERGVPSPVDTSTSLRSRRELYYVPADSSRYERPPTPEPSRTASRVWTMRVPSPSVPPARRSSFSGEGNFRAPSPPLTKESSLVMPSWKGPSFDASDRTHSAIRYPNNSRLQNRIDTASRPAPMFLDSHPRRPHDVPLDRGRERFGPDGLHRGGGLEDRLGERYDERYVEPSGSYRPRASPPIRHEVKEYTDEPPRQVRSDNRGRAYSFGAERPNDHWTSLAHIETTSPMNSRPDRVRLYDEMPYPPQPDDHIPSRMSKPPIHVRRTPSTSQSRQFDMHQDAQSELLIEGAPLANSRGRDRARDIDRGLPEPPRSQERPHALRRGGSLLDRLSLDDAAGTMASPSLRERVQLPMKRDREEMSRGEDDSHSLDASYEYDDAGGADSAKRNKRRNGKVRRGKKI